MGASVICGLLILTRKIEGRDLKDLLLVPLTLFRVKSTVPFGRRSQHRFVCDSLSLTLASSNQSQLGAVLSL